MVNHDDVAGLDTVYFKTNITGEDSLAGELFAEDYAVVHYCDFPVSFNKKEIKCETVEEVEYDASIVDEADLEDWMDERNKLEKKVDYINEWAEKGAVIGVENEPVHAEGVLLGYIPPQEKRKSPVTHLLVCTDTTIEAEIRVHPSDTWNDIYQRREQYTAPQQQILKELEEHRDAGKGRNHETYNVFQALELLETTWAWYRNHPPLHAYRKQGTCHRWKQNKEYLRAAVSGGGDFREIGNTKSRTSGFEDEVFLLSDGQLEMLCAEYLRRAIADTFVQELPVGRSRSTVDITGFDPVSDTLYLAQVSFENSGSDLREKIESLAQFAEESETDDENQVESFFFSAATKESIEGEFQQASCIDQIDNYHHISEPYKWTTEGADGGKDDWKLGRETLVERFVTIPNPRKSADPRVT